MNAESDKNEEKSFNPKKIRMEVIKFLLRKYGNLRTKEIAEILGLSERTIRRTLKKLENLEKARKVKVGKSYIWKLQIDESDRAMYF